MLISFVVPAHDEAAWLQDCLQAIAIAAQGLDHEVVVVADSCSDITAFIAQSAGAFVVHAHRRQIAASRNTGARWSTGELLCFVDADTRITAAALHAAVQRVEEGAGGAGARLRFDQRSDLLERLLVRIVSRGFSLFGVIPGCFLLCRRETFDAIGGFDERYYAAEDVLFSRALRRHGGIRIVPHPIVSSERKLHSHGPRAHLALLWRLLRFGPKAVLQSRRHLGLWYDGWRARRDGSR